MILITRYLSIFFIAFSAVFSLTSIAKAEGEKLVFIYHSGDEDFWIDTFLEMLSLSKCNTLIYRVSNLNNASVLFSQAIKDTVKIQ